MSTLVHSHIHTHSPHTLSPHTYFPLTDIPSQLRLQALQLVMLLMPDENREALLSLLTFLKEVAEHADTNQMDANNLAVCFSPTLFSASSVPKLSPIAHRGSFRRTVVNHSPNLATNREITEAVVSICFWPSFQGPSLYVKLQASSVRYPEIQFWNGYITP